VHAYSRTHNTYLCIQVRRTYIFLSQGINILYIYVELLLFFFLTHSHSVQLSPSVATAAENGGSSLCAFIDRTFLQLNLSVRLFWIDQIASAEKKCTHTRPRYIYLRCTYACVRSRHRIKL